MKDIALITFEHYADPARFVAIGEGICQAVAAQDDLEPEAGDYLLALTFAFENEKEKSDYPYLVEDLLERHNAFSPYAEIRAIKADLVGKRVFYTPVMEDGKEYLRLTTE